MADSADSAGDVVLSLADRLPPTDARPPEVTMRDIDVLRTRLELLHDMNDRDRRERELQRQAIQAAMTEMAQRVADVHRDHRAIRQTVGDLAAMVNRQSADGSALRAALDQVRAAVTEAREDGRTTVRQAHRDTKRSLEQLEAHVRMDRDRLTATAGAVAELTAALEASTGRQAEALEALDRVTRMVDGVGARVGEDLRRQQATELEHVGALQQQLTEAIAVIEELGAVTKRQAGQITKLRADLKKVAAAPAPPAAKAPAKKAAKPSGRTGQAARRAT